MKKTLLILILAISTWLSNAQIPYMVKDIYSSGDSNPDFLTNVNGVLYFVAYDAAHGRELWKSDGTAAGTVMVKDINPGSGNGITTSSGVYYYFANVNGVLYFTATDGTNGRELWKSDGTEAGTVMVSNIYPGSGSSDPYLLTNVNGVLYFVANNGTNGDELWKSDGTEAGTVMVKDIRNGSNPSTPRFLTNVNGVLYFVAYTAGPFDAELWKSDGTDAGTVLVKDIVSGNTGSNPESLININGVLYFCADDGSGKSLWKSDGTVAGTVKIKKVTNVSDSEGGSKNQANVNGVLYFMGSSGGVNGYGLWKSDGTADGTVLLKNVSGTGSPQYFTNVNGVLYFQATDGTNGYELWKSDGTPEGTVMVKNISTTGSSAPIYLTNVNGVLYFAANNGTKGNEPWKSDGTDAGTVIVQDIRNGGSGSDPSNFINVNGMLFFTASNGGYNGNELWALNTTLPVSLLNFTAKAEGHYAKLQWQTAQEVNNKGFEVWRGGDGTSTGSVGQFVKIGEMSALATHNTQPVTYNFTDKNSLNGTNYYKLVQVDKDGKATELGVKTVTFNFQPSTFNLYPNPVKDVLTLQGNLSAVKTVVITNVSGKVLQHLPAQAQINVANLSTGIYLIKLYQENGTAVLKFIKE